MYDLSYFVGCPFRDGGRGTEIDPVTKKPYFDCYGLFRAVFKHIYGIDLPDVIVSCFNILEINRLYHTKKSQWQKIDTPTEPCAVAMKSNPAHPRLISHFGVYIGRGRFIHTLEKTGSIISSVSDKYYSRCIGGFYKYEG
mgnify:FL=1